MSLKILAVIIDRILSSKELLERYIRARYASSQLQVVDDASRLVLRPSATHDAQANQRSELSGPPT